MSPVAANSTLPKRARWVVALIVAHLGLAIIVAAASSYFVQLLVHLPIHDFLANAGYVIFGAPEGVQAGQIVLIACWGAFSGQPWYLRFPRFLVLLCWWIWAFALGMLLVEGDLVRRLAEEQAAFAILQISVPVIILFTVGIVSAKRFRQSVESERGRSWQFGTRNLLLLTAEVAVILALGRIVLPGTFSAEEFWNGLTGNRALELLPAAMGVMVLPVVLVALMKRPTWRHYLALLGYLLVTSLLYAIAWFALFGSMLELFPGTTGWSAFGLTCLYSLVRHLSAAATILLTFYFLRRIGYDFRRRDELPRLGSSSNASNSAASASA